MYVVGKIFFYKQKTLFFQISNRSDIVAIFNIFQNFVVFLECSVTSIQRIQILKVKKVIFAKASKLHLVYQVTLARLCFSCIYLGKPESQMFTQLTGKRSFYRRLKFRFLVISDDQEDALSFSDSFGCILFPL